VCHIFGIAKGNKLAEEAAEERIDLIEVEQRRGIH